jgi:DNA (cytosine-5)-methyltransferase 1
MRVGISEHPVRHRYRHLLDLVSVGDAAPLSHRAAAGFQRRLARGNLGRHPGFRDDVARHVDLGRPGRSDRVPPMAV